MGYLKGGLISVRMMNLSEDSQIVYPGTFVASLSNVDVVIDTNYDQEYHCDNLPPHLEDLFARSTEQLKVDERSALKKFLIKYANIFAKSDADLGRTSIVKHTIDTKDVRPLKEPPRRVPYHMEDEMNKQIDDMLDRNIIEKSNSPWTSGVVLAKKKDGSLRFCVDYRRLNAATVKDAYPLPRIDESLDSLSGAKWFSTLDLCSGYWQVSMDETDKLKTAFATKRGLFHFNVMPFGLYNAPAYFERLMETILSGLQWQICLIYLGGIIVVGNTFKNMLDNLTQVFDRLLSSNLKFKAKKCHLFSKTVEFLGHLVSEEGVSTDPSKVLAVKNWHQ